MPVSTGAQGCLHPKGVGSAREGVFLLGGGVLPSGSGSGPKGGAWVPWYPLQLQSEGGPTWFLCLDQQVAQHACQGLTYPVGEAVAHVFACL